MVIWMSIHRYKLLKLEYLALPLVTHRIFKEVSKSTFCKKFLKKSLSVNGSRYSRMDQVKIVEDCL